MCRIPAHADWRYVLDMSKPQYSTPWIHGVAKVIIWFTSEGDLLIDFFGPNGETCDSFSVLTVEEGEPIQIEITGPEP